MGKMPPKYKITTRGMVLWILGMYPDTKHSVAEIQEKILKHFECEIHRNTVTKAINEHDYVGGNILESSERRGLFKLPTKVYTINKIIQSN